MVLTAKQKEQLNKDILEYLVGHQYSTTAEHFSAEISTSLADVDPDGTRLETKWKSILSLQKKISILEEENKNLKEELSKGPGQHQSAPSNPQDLFLLKTPAKFEMKGHKTNVSWLCFHPMYTQLATASEDGTVKIWEFETGEFERTLKGHTSRNCQI
jgi:platelet-activating factor acetylhydrolase IB subunit alpha